MTRRPTTPSPAWTSRRIRRRRSTRAARAGLLAALLLGALVLGAEPLTQRAEAPGAAPAHVASPTPAVSSSPPAVTAPALVAPQPDTTVEPVERFVATPSRPAALWVVGDSLTESFGPALVAEVEASGLVSAEHELRYSSGLTRPDFHDWPARLEQRLTADPPLDIVVFMVGANDAQPIEIGGSWVEFGTATWVKEYRRRAERAAAVLAGGARSVYWVGQPIARSNSYSERMDVLNDVYEAVANAHANVRYVSSWELFQSEGGGYAARLPDDEGSPVLVRRSDGIHVTPSGGEWLAAHVLDVIREDWTIGSSGS